MTGRVEVAGVPSPAGRLASPDRLRSLFAPRSLALVGASDTSGWATNVYQSLRTAGFDDLARFRQGNVPFNP